tara:strand:- start:1505 stop:1942 length:438 start_codon:yes stop_codon:yes gene_type:complete
MNLSNFITLGRQVFRTLDSLTFQDRTLIKTYISLLEDELVRISNELEKPVKRDEISLKTYNKIDSRFSKEQIHQNMLNYFKSNKSKVPFKYLEYNKEFNANPFDKKIKTEIDLFWLKEKYPSIYSQQKKLAYWRLNGQWRTKNKK